MLALALLLPLALAGTPEVTVPRPRGVALSQLPFYDPSGPFRCLDGSGPVAFSWVNDDYCDCQDGSDEPGTPACPNGRFHCASAGHRPRSIPAAHVNDGVCDCCDGNDEWGSGAGCENTCREKGRKEREEPLRRRAARSARSGPARDKGEGPQEREERLRSAALAREGFALRQRLVQEAAEGKREKQARLQALQEARQALQERAGSLRAAKEAAEGPEQAARGEHQRKLTLAELRARPELDGAEIEEEEPEEEEEEEEEDEGPEQVVPVPPQEGEGEGEEPPQEEPPFDPETQALIDAAQRVRDDLAAAERELKEAEEGIRALELELGLDFGPEGEFSYLYSQCWELGTSEYLYRLCPFQRVTQRPKNGGAETSLGLWGSWAGPEGAKFGAQKYEGGTGCWQGPARATTVRLRCGPSTALTAASEPSRCEYLLELETPAACREPPALHEEHDEL
ncbi:glucosidase 2 subunit beta [Camarhynchus parvulus]|uniref:glucosidase 2 subunit beta n=1 Tax=Geospiza parvula TaxID=87175 RepID=UPI0012382798|nr:glucosidase 2 subunit beta [Camarhynchus parvulus]